MTLVVDPYLRMNWKPGVKTLREGERRVKMRSIKNLKKFQPSRNLKFSLAKWLGDPCYNSKTDLTRYGL